MSNKYVGSYPHTIDNGQGERLIFLGHVQNESEDYLEVENYIQPKAGPPLHVHYLQEEVLTVVSGSIAYQNEGQDVQYASAGETFRFTPGVAHRFWNNGQDILHCTGYITPAYNLEYFLSAIYDSIISSGGHRPNPFDAAFLLTRYKSEFGMMVVPDLVQKFIFPVQILIGNLLGKYDKYKDAPPPLSETDIIASQRSGIR